MAETGESRPGTRRRRKEARPGEIVDAGLAEFAARGFAATRLDDVARRAGVAKGTIYRYFDDKEALFVAVVRSRVASVLTDMDARLDSYPGPSRDLIVGLVEMFYRRLVEGDLRVILRMVIAEAENFPGLTDLYYAEVIAKGRRVLERIVRRGIERGDLRAGPATDLPIILMSPALMATIWTMTFDRVAPIPVRSFLEAHLDLILNGILARPVGPGSDQDRA